MVFKTVLDASPSSNTLDSTRQLKLFNKSNNVLIDAY